jgi:hypothetical protein
MKISAVSALSCSNPAMENPAFDVQRFAPI